MNDHWCGSCGQRIRKLNPHHMDSRKIALLDLIGRLNAQGYEWVKVQRDGALIPLSQREFTIQCDDVHALRMTWFGLLERKELRSGLYKITDNGILFMKGQLTVPAKILCRDGRVWERSDKRVAVGNVRGLTLDKNYWDHYGEVQEPPNGQGLFGDWH